MKRRVLVYRAEDGAQAVFGEQSIVTKPDDRRPIDTFTINESDVDRARRIVSDFVLKRHKERPESMQILADGGVSVTLRAPRS